MKFNTLIIAAAAALSLAACSPKSSENTENSESFENSESSEISENSEATETSGNYVIELKDAAAIAPGFKPERLTVIDFNAVWCGPCRQLTPVLEDMAAKYAGAVDFYSVDVDSFGELFEAYNVGNSIPAVVFVQPDGTATSYVGTGDLLPASKFDAIVANLLK